MDAPQIALATEPPDTVNHSKDVLSREPDFGHGLDLASRVGQFATRGVEALDTADDLSRSTGLRDGEVAGRSQPSSAMELSPHLSRQTQLFHDPFNLIFDASTAPDRSCSSKARCIPFGQHIAEGPLPNELPFDLLNETELVVEECDELLRSSLGQTLPGSAAQSESKGVLELLLCEPNT